ncbi:MAG TPA: hypothetical protein VGB92_06145 [Longimicrobium sp.]|jgi:hypothetical protein
MSRLLNSRRMRPNSEDGARFLTLRQAFQDPGGNVAIAEIYSAVDPQGGTNDYVVQSDQAANTYYLLGRSGIIAKEHSEGVLEYLMPNVFPKGTIRMVFSEREPCRLITAEDCDTKLARLLEKYGESGLLTPVRWFQDYYSHEDYDRATVTRQHNEARAYLNNL